MAGCECPIVSMVSPEFRLQNGLASSRLAESRSKNQKPRDILAKPVPGQVCARVPKIPRLYRHWTARREGWRRDYKIAKCKYDPSEWRVKISCCTHHAARLAVRLGSSSLVSQAPGRYVSRKIGPVLFHAKLRTTRRPTQTSMA